MPKLLHDGPLWISKGKSRNEKNWKNVQTTWGALVEHLQKTQVTRETHKEYMSYSKTDQDNIKDIGGFVGGIVNGGRRKKYNIGMRQLLTLDVDTVSVGSNGEGGADFWMNLQLDIEGAMCVYSTHKHSPRTPRYRLLLPLDREVHADEYEALARKMAELLGMELFDHTTFQPERLMYWPSTPRDVVYFHRYQDGPWLSADKLLGMYRDWRDLSQWPRHRLERDRLAREIKTVGDPLEKGGVVGAFCKTFGIKECIDRFLSDVYQACDVPDRYTYLSGSTSAGLVVYEDKWAYSHHSTDPASEKLCNAFDLVRLHQFGNLDKEDDDTPINRRPSYLSMLDLALQEEPVKLLVTADKLEKARYDFRGTPENIGEEDDGLEGPDEFEAQKPVSLKDLEWVTKLDLDRKGNPYNTIDNVLVILRNDPRLKGKFSYNAFTHRELVNGNLPWRAVSRSTNLFTDKDDAGLRCYLESLYKITVASKIQDAMVINFLNNSFHPIRDFIKGLSWDGVPRLDTLLIDYLGAEDTEYTRIVCRKTIVAAITRIFRPGIKYETVLTLMGRQGLGKSTLLRKLFQPWFSDSFHTFQGNKAVEALQGAWAIELGELSAMKKAEVETVKSFISCQVDRMRWAYGHRVEDFPRQCIFIATTNETHPLKDQTGNRRWWPVRCGVTEPIKSVFTGLTSEDQQQILAEAYQLFLNGETLFLEERLEQRAFLIQNAYREQDDRTRSVQVFLNKLLPANWEDVPVEQRIAYFKDTDITDITGTDFIELSKELRPRTRVCAAEIWVELFRGPHIAMSPQNTRFIHDIMRNMPGWEPYEKTKEEFEIYGVQRSYQRRET